MTVFREGQRVRIEWPDAFVEDTATRVEQLGEWYGRRSGVGLDGAWIRDDRVVTVLHDPKPDEPTGLYAVVRDPEDEDPTPWVRDGVAPGRPWWRFAKGQPLVCRQWADFSDRVEVLFPGVES